MIKFSLYDDQRQEIGVATLPAVPRVGEILYYNDKKYFVIDVTWRNCSDFVQLTVRSSP